MKGLQVEDLYTLDEEATVGLGEIKALIFLFKYVNGIEESTRAGELVSPSLSPFLSFEGVGFDAFAFDCWMGCIQDPNFPGVFINQVITNGQ